MKIVDAIAADAIQHKRTGKWKFVFSFPFEEGPGTITIKSQYDFESDGAALDAMTKQAWAHNVRVVP